MMIEQDQTLIEPAEGAAQGHAARLRTVPSLFEAQVARTPDAVALVDGCSSLSYRELNARANILARRLQDSGAGPDRVVAICLRRTADMMVAVLAVLKSGAGYLPLDPTYPHERLQFMLDDARALALVTQDALVGMFPASGHELIVLDQGPGTRGSPENLQTKTAAEHLAYLIYTSGSTGRPKGVAMTHGPLVNLLDWQCRNSAMGPGDRTVQFTSLSFDVSFQEIFSTWCSGGSLVLITEELRYSPRDLLDFLESERINRLFLPFVALQQLADAASARARLSLSLREVITAGEQLQITPQIRELFSRLGGCSLHNHYGPSETHVVTAYTLVGDPAQWPALPPIGKAIDGVGVYLLDESGRPVSDQESGEIYISGVALARGYHERPDETLERFVPDPFAEGAGQRMYKTGDLARVQADGNIHFLGRIDHQIKIRGYRVELGEIETVLAAHRGVRECIVDAKESRPGETKLVAYVVGHVDQRSVGALKDYLRLELPEYMVPSAFCILDRFPLTPSGKIDRRALPEPSALLSDEPLDPFEAPGSSIEFQLVQIWEELLHVRPIRVTDNFFELGGHSLLAARMMDRVEQVTGRRLPLTTLFEDATVSRLARLLCQTDDAGSLVELQAGCGVPLYFLHGDLYGGGFYARDLARGFGEDQAFFVLPPLPMTSAEVPTVEEMADDYLAMVKTHRPEGPYMLGGFCLGALVANVMANRLREQGDEVRWLFLLDPDLHDDRMRRLLRVIGAFGDRVGWNDDRKAWCFLRWFMRLDGLAKAWRDSWAAVGRFIAETLRKHWPSRLGGSRALRGPRLDAGGSPQRDLLVLYEWIMGKHEPPRIADPVTIVFSDEQLANKPFLKARWELIAPKADIHVLPGAHLEFITKGSRALTDTLLSGLRSAQSATDRSTANEGRGRSVSDLACASAPAPISALSADSSRSTFAQDKPNRSARDRFARLAP